MITFREDMKMPQGHVVFYFASSGCKECDRFELLSVPNIKSDICIIKFNTDIQPTVNIYDT